MQYQLGVGTALGGNLLQVVLDNAYLRLGQFHVRAVWGFISAGYYAVQVFLLSLNSAMSRKVFKATSRDI